LIAPDQAVSQSYLHTLAVLSVYVQHPELRAVQTPESKGKLVAGGPISKRQDLVQQAEAQYAATLASALPKKTAAARTVSALELRMRLASPALISQGRLIIDGFADLPPDQQTRLLEYEWRSLAHPDMVPVLQKLASRPGSVADLALRRLYELDPADGRARILREIANPQFGASLKTLGALPDAELRQLDDALAANVEKATDRLDGVEIPLLSRYASSAVAPRMLARFGKRVGTMACRPQSYLLAYFLRTAPADGAALLDRVLASRTNTGCYQFVLSDVAELGMTPAIEGAALRSLDDPHPRVVQNAISALGQYGSAAARQPLRSRFERWSAEWRGRQDELRYNAFDKPNQPSAMQERIEAASIQALGGGMGWLTSAGEMAGLRALCVTDNCRAEAQRLAESAGGTTITIFTYDDPPGFTARLAQYEVRSMDLLRVKLRQYTRDTAFKADLSALDLRLTSGARSDLERLAKELGIAFTF
jgi:hypothetical protein